MCVHDHSSTGFVLFPQSLWLFEIYFLLCFSFLKNFIEFVTILLQFYVLFFCSWGMWNLNFLVRNQTHTPCTGRWSLNHWTTRDVPWNILLIPISFPSIKTSGLWNNLGKQSTQFVCKLDLKKKNNSGHLFGALFWKPGS